MITGCNQDVTHKGKSYHVQTEDRGEKNPCVETLIYLGGEIIASRRTSYEDLLKEGYDEAKITTLLESQHKRTVVDIRLGKFEPEEESSFGDGLISSRSLDEVILDYLTSENEGEKLAVEILDQSPIVFGERAWYRLTATTDITKRPLAGAAVEVHMASSNGQKRKLFSGSTDQEGLCAASFTVPAVRGSAAVLLVVKHGEDTFRVKALVTRKGKG